MKIKLTEFHKENMRKHIAFLRDNADLIKNHFDMRTLQNPQFIGCGTPACSLGWAAVSVGCVSTIYEDTTEEAFGISDFSYNPSNEYWDYLFGQEWFYVNNTPEAAAARMEAVLYNQVPKRWDYTEEFAHPIVEIPGETLSESKTLEYIPC